MSSYCIAAQQFEFGKYALGNAAYSSIILGSFSFRYFDYLLILELLCFNNG